MQIATDANGKVWFVGQGLASEINGIPLTLHTLTQEQEAAYSSLRADREYATFDGAQFVAVGQVVKERV